MAQDVKARMLLEPRMMTSQGEEFGDGVKVVSGGLGSAVLLMATHLSLMMVRIWATLIQEQNTFWF